MTTATAERTSRAKPPETGTDQSAINSIAAGADQSSEKPAQKPDQKQKPWLVLDTLAINETRTHEMEIQGVVRDIRFHPREPTRLPFAVAVRFLATPTFILVDEDGNPLPWQNAPRQPHEFGAGERFVLESGNVVAALSELHTAALRARALRFKGAERFGEGGSRDQMIEFIIAETEKKLKETGREGRPIGDNIDLEEFTPEAEPDNSPLFSDEM